MRTLNDLVRQGKVRYIGCSNLFAWQILKANGISLLHHLETFSCGQYLYNLVNRDAEREILPACMDQGMGFTSWSPLAGGFLLGKYQNTEKPSEGSRFSYRMEVDGTRFWHPRGFEAAAKVFTLSRKLSISPLKLALSWVLYQPRVTSIIIGVKNLEQLHENLIVGDWDLPRESWEEVDRETAYDLGHLNQFSTFVRKSIFGIHE
jgi:aryl-alcohol dehydrogenase-like predicted oxidoreductase